MKEKMLPEFQLRKHSMVDFNSQYLKRVSKIAMEKRMGVCFLHSHPFPDWQGMSSDDIDAETKMAHSVYTLTDQPFVGMTVGNDGTWSGRVWNHQGEGNFKMQWAHIVKSVGKALQLSYNYKLLPIALVTGLGGVHDFGVQRYRYNNGYLSSYDDRQCLKGCSFTKLIATGDTILNGID